jgi:hypothetical protein
MELDRTLWRDRPHIGVKQLWEYLCSYLYLPRLKDRDVLLRAIQEGTSTVVASDAFAYAEDYDEERGRYVGLRLGGGGSVVMDSSSLLVKPEVAREQLKAEEKERAGLDGGSEATRGITYTPMGDGGEGRIADPPTGTEIRQ